MKATISESVSELRIKDKFGSLLSSFDYKSNDLRIKFLSAPSLSSTKMAKRVNGVDQNRQNQNKAKRNDFVEAFYSRNSKLIDEKLRKIKSNFQNRLVDYKNCDKNSKSNKKLIHMYDLKKSNRMKKLLYNEIDNTASDLRIIFTENLRPESVIPDLKLEKDESDKARNTLHLTWNIINKLNQDSVDGNHEIIKIIDEYEIFCNRVALNELSDEESDKVDYLSPITWTKVID
jgi:hypothetical protein